MFSTNGSFSQESPQISLGSLQTKFIESPVITAKHTPFSPFYVTTDPKFVNILPGIRISIEKIFITQIPLNNVALTVSYILIEA